MLVAASLRSGATKFCLDLAYQKGIPFRGDLNTRYSMEMGPNGGADSDKSQFHETGYQPTYPLQTYIKYWDYLEDPSQIFLWSRDLTFIPALKAASYYVTRKSPRKAAYSLINWVLKHKLQNRANNFKTNVGASINNARSVIESAYILCYYTRFKNKPVTFYEDFTNRDTEYTFLRENTDYYIPIRDTVNFMMDRFDFPALYPEMQDTPE